MKVHQKFGSYESCRFQTLFLLWHTVLFFSRVLFSYLLTREKYRRQWMDLVILFLRVRILLFMVSSGCFISYVFYCRIFLIINKDLIDCNT